MSKPKPAALSPEAAASARMSSATRPTNTFERRSGVDSRTVAADSPTERVDHAAGAASGIALIDTASGIESEPPVGSVKQALAEEKFMSEIVDISLHSPGTEDEHRFVEVTVNGRYLCLARSEETIHSIPRSHLAVIASSKTQRLVQKKITAPDGSMGYEEKAVLQALYPFSVISDPNPKGGAWLRQMLQRS